MSDPSEFFNEAFLGCGGGSPVAHCGCGRTTFCNSDHYDDGELASLLEKQRENPERLIYTDYDSVSHYQIWGVTLVYGCPCDGMSRLEKQLWNHRKQIASYLTLRAKAQAVDAASILGTITPTPPPHEED